MINLGGVIGFFIGRPKKVNDINVEYEIERLRSDSIVFKKAYDLQYSLLQEYKNNELIFKKGYDSISEIHAKNRATGIYGGGIEKRIKSINDRGRSIYGN